MMPQLTRWPVPSADDAERLVAGASYGRELFSCEPMGRRNLPRAPLRARPVAFSDAGIDPGAADMAGDEATGEAPPVPRFRPRTKRNRLAAAR